MVESDLSPSPVLNPPHHIVGVDVVDDAPDALSLHELVDRPHRPKANVVAPHHHPQCECHQRLPEAQGSGAREIEMVGGLITMQISRLVP